MRDVRKLPDEPVPLHLRNAPTKMMENLGYGRDYRYSHDHPDHFVEQQYLPDALKSRVYYRPTGEGEEKTIRDRLHSWWKGKKKEG
jgi:putative ATPase